MPFKNDNYRPISILPILSKVYEKLAICQITDFLMENAILQSNISSYRKCHSTTTTILAIRDDILKAKRGEVTLAIMAELLHTVDFVLYKLHLIGFLGFTPQWRARKLTELMTDRRHKSVLLMGFLRDHF